MNPVVETGALIAATIVVGITLILVPVPKQKPPEIDKPPVQAPAEPPSPQDIVSLPTVISIEALPTELEQAEQAVKLSVIEQRVRAIQAKVKKLEAQTDKVQD